MYFDVNVDNYIAAAREYESAVYDTSNPYFSSTVYAGLTGVLLGLIAFHTTPQEIQKRLDALAEELRNETKERLSA